jgi:hypothetical protein
LVFKIFVQAGTLFFNRQRLEAEILSRFLPDGSVAVDSQQRTRVGFYALLDEVKQLAKKLFSQEAQG